MNISQISARIKKSVTRIGWIVSLIITSSCNKTTLNSVAFSFDASNPTYYCTCSSDSSFASTDVTTEQGHTHDDNYYYWNMNCEGMKFSIDESYAFDKMLERIPLTFEATFEIPADYTERAGVLVGNFKENQAAINFEIYNNGNPRLYYADSSGAVHDYIFSDVSVNTGKKLHLAIVDDPTTGLFKCYVNGEIKQTLPNLVYKGLPSTVLRVGSDERYLNSQFFKGTLYNVALFSSIHSEREINIDISKIDITDDNLLAAFETTKESYQANIKSINSKFDLIYKSNWIANVDVPTNYSYSFAVIGDTQTMCYRWPDDFSSIYDYVIDNKQNEKIACCIGLGDITDKDTKQEWDLAKRNIDMLNNKVPYLINRGNHDSLTFLNNYFGREDEYYYSSIDGFFKYNRIENVYKTLVIGNQKYLIFALDYGIPDEVMNWAESIIEQYSDYRVIITTHAYLFRDGTTLGENDICPPSSKAGLNNGDEILDKFISKHNIDLVLCGHDPTDDIVITKNKNNLGSYVTQVLVNPQDIDLWEPKGMISMFYFSNNGNTIDIRYFSTVKRMWYKSENQVTIHLNDE